MLFSVVSISYKDPGGLAATLKSLKPLQAAGLPWEHIIVDGSPDANRKVLQTLEPGWPTVYIEELPKGIYAAMNTGMERTRGDVVWFLHGGDVLNNFESLKAALDEMQENPSIALLCAQCDMIENGKYLYTKYTKKTFLRSIVGRSRLYQQAVLYRRKDLFDIGKFSTQLKIASDYEHYFKYYLAGKKARIYPGAFSSLDVAGISHENWKQSLQEARQVAEHMKAELPFVIYYWHRIRIFIEYLRVLFLKTLANSFVGPALRPLWHWWNRRKRDTKWPSGG